jgi:hypothetical protein
LKRKEDLLDQEGEDQFLVRQSEGFLEGFGKAKESVRVELILLSRREESKRIRLEWVALRREMRLGLTCECVEP